MFSYPVRCHCSCHAQFKIAARWSDGQTVDHKTYALTCEECLASAFLNAVEKQKLCRLAKRETLDAPAIFELQQGKRNSELTRRQDLEQQFQESFSSHRDQE